MNFLAGVGVASVGAGLGAVGGYLGGYIYGALFNADKALAAKVYAVSTAAGVFVGMIIGKVTGGPQGEHRSAFHLSTAFFGGILQIASIVALRHFELIATRGTVICSAALFYNVVDHLIRAADA